MGVEERSAARRKGSSTSLTFFVVLTGKTRLVQFSRCLWLGSSNRDSVAMVPLDSSGIPCGRRARTAPLCLARIPLGVRMDGVGASAD